MFVFIILVIAAISWKLAINMGKAYKEQIKKEQAVSYTVSSFRGVTVLKVDGTKNGFFWKKEVTHLERGIPRWVVWAFGVLVSPLVAIMPILPHVFMKAVLEGKLSKKRQWAAVQHAANGHFGKDYYIVVGPDATEDVIHHEWVHYTQMGDSQTRFERELEAYSKAQGYTGWTLQRMALLSSISH